jgi:trehalose-6-phosphate synthase
MELCSCGTLREAYSRPRDTMGMARLVSRLLEVAKGMAFLHANNVLHGEHVIDGMCIVTGQAVTCQQCNRARIMLVRPAQVSSEHVVFSVL